MSGCRESPRSRNFFSLRGKNPALLHLSGCRESNSDYANLHPVKSIVGALGIEPSLREPESRVLPVYYAPIFNRAGRTPACRQAGTATIFTPTIKNLIRRGHSPLISILIIPGFHPELRIGFQLPFDYSATCEQRQ
jgi:hypothetical protein